MHYRSFDPFRQSLLSEHPVDDRLDASELVMGATVWRSTPLEDKIACFLRLADVLESDAGRLARLITCEMGKPVSESQQEIKKCINAIRQLVLMAPSVLKVRDIPSEGKSSYVVPEPFGLLLAVMPWNFPFWQVLRFAVPNMLAGNTVLLKHAPNVPECAAALQALFGKAGFPSNVFISRYLSEAGVEKWLTHPAVAGLAFTGSDRTGSLLGAVAGRALKKSLMELGGNDPFIVFEDADQQAAVGAAVASRCINGGQACNGAKRFLIHRAVYDSFLSRLIERVAALKIGDPLDDYTAIGPLARFDLLEKVRDQVRHSVDQGAEPAFVAALQSDAGWFYPPTVLTQVVPGNTAFEEEIFGPVWSVTVFDSDEDALRLANQSAYGLGASVWTLNEARIERLTRDLHTGNVFVNDFVRSDPRFPFGGVKRSGYGKDLGEQGFLEFVNWKTVYRADG